jgi:glycosyltransferase involved in cell wall biosynthesis
MEVMVAKHIVHISTVHVDSDTRIVHKQCRGLAGLGYNVTLLIQSDFDIEYGRFRIKALPRTSNRAVRMTVLMAKSFRLAWFEQADIYHLHDPELMLMGLLLKVLGKTVVFDMHENLPEQIINKAWISKWLRWPISYSIKLIERIVLTQLSVVMAEKSYLKSYLWVKNKEVILNLPMVDELIKLSVSKFDTPTVGYIGGITRDRGAFATLNALNNIRADRVPVNFECIGQIESAVINDDGFQQAINDGWVHAPGRMSPTVGWEIISRCHIGIAILRPIGNYLESYPTKMFEYMAMGLPVIVSDFELYKGVVEKHKCGICVDPENTKQVTDAIRYLLSNPNEAREMGKRGQQATLKYYNWQVELDKLVAFYNKLL